MALPHELVERAHGLLDRRGRIESVDLVEVDVVELQPLQAGLDPVQDVAARGAARVRSRAGLAEDLGRDDHVLARHLEILQRLAGDLLRHAPGVDIGGVDEVDAGVNRLAHEALCVGLLQATDLARDAVGAAEGHGAQAKLGDEQAGTAEGMVAHGRSSFVTMVKWS